MIEDRKWDAGLADLTDFLQLQFISYDVVVLKYPFNVHYIHHFCRDTTLLLAQQHYSATNHEIATRKSQSRNWNQFQRVNYIISVIPRFHRLFCLSASEKTNARRGRRMNKRRIKINNNFKCQRLTSIVILKIAKIKLLYAIVESLINVACTSHV